MIPGLTGFIIRGRGHGVSMCAIIPGQAGHWVMGSGQAGSTLVLAMAGADVGAAGPVAAGGVPGFIIPVLRGADTGPVFMAPTFITTERCTEPASIRISMPVAAGDLRGTITPITIVAL